MKKQILKMIDNGVFVVVHDDAQKYNPYRIYYEWYNNGKQKNLLQKYADFGSCLLFLHDVHTGKVRV